ncbi:MAG: 1-deoxy-D-xylulose-5-phosphate reductoisomerase [Bacteroidales bacterium]|nr:1-deoxy-D-xylulose-5-phosphate reductoisomerase [Bacteroidales bacterium]
MTEKRKIALLGSTGSIGTQALEVVENHSDILQIEVLTAQNNADLLIQQAKKFSPNMVVIGNEALLPYVKEALWNDDIKVFAGPRALEDVVQMDCVDIVLTAIVGVAGLAPVYKAIEAGKTIALANKETLVVAGELMTRAVRENGAAIYPVDSEHSAIFQCLAGEFHNPVSKILLTASGGPFRGKKREELRFVTKDDALRHPNWSMGPKVTIDSATLMNKGLEVIEAKWLFGVPVEKIEVLVHPQSIVHSMVEFEDGSVKAQLGLPDMKLPIQYALTYPQRQPSNFPRLNFTDHGTLTFEQPDRDTFPCLDLAFKASREGGCMPCVMNAANESAVALFLQGRIGFYDIPHIIEEALMHTKFCQPTSVEEYLYIDQMVKQQIERI